MANLNSLKKQIVQMAYRAGEGHIPSAFSILDIVWVLYDKYLNVSPTLIHNPNRDRFVLSKGQASLALYVVLADKNFFPQDELDHASDHASILGGHPDATQVPGVEVSTGSLGHGMPMAVGMALGNRLAKRAAKTVVLIGDGEANEGTIWESALLASHHKLDQLTCILDHNHSTDRALKVDDLAAKFSSFGWKVLEVDGHNQIEILKALNKTHPDQPLAIIAHTIKGKGVVEMENNPAWHHRAPTKEEVEQILKELS